VERSLRHRIGLDDIDGRVGEAARPQAVTKLLPPPLEMIVRIVAEAVPTIVVPLRLVSSREQPSQMVFLAENLASELVSGSLRDLDRMMATRALEMGMSTECRLPSIILLEVFNELDSR